MIQRVQHIVFCTVVMQCSESSECQQVELEMGRRGFQPRGDIVRRGSSCVCCFQKEHAEGAVDQLRDEACEQIATATESHVASWRGYVQVCGKDGAWATLVPGKPPVLGSIDNA